MTADLAEPAESTVAVIDAEQQADALRHVTSNLTQDDFERMVGEAKEDIQAGEVFQVVLSQRFSAPCPADALDVYRVLRSSNPSPYMYPVPAPGARRHGIRRGGLVAGGARQGDGPPRDHPPDRRLPAARQDPEEDLALAEELLADPKGDPSTSCSWTSAATTSSGSAAPGTVDVVEFMKVRRYSHVTHLESTVIGDLGEGRTAYDVLEATFPAGTLSGAQASGAQPHRALRAEPAWHLRRRRRVPGLPRRPRHGHRHPHRRHQGRCRPRAGRCRHRRRLGAGHGYEETVNKAAAALRAVAAATALGPSGEATAPHVQGRRRPPGPARRRHPAGQRLARLGDGHRQRRRPGRQPDHRHRDPGRPRASSPWPWPQPLPPSRPPPRAASCAV